MQSCYQRSGPRPVMKVPARPIASWRCYSVTISKQNFISWGISRNTTQPSYEIFIEMAMPSVPTVTGIDIMNMKGIIQMNWLDDIFLSVSGIVLLFGIIVLDQGWLEVCFSVLSRMGF